MTENQNLYFIRLLQEAFRNPDRKRAMKAAIDEIESKSTLAEYREGYRNFQAFLQAIDKYASSEPEIASGLGAEAMESKMIEILTNTFEGNEKDKQAIIELIKADPGLLSDYEALKTEISEFLPAETAIMIEILKDGRPYTSFAYKPLSSLISVKGITPGSYAIKLSTGLLLWEGHLQEKELIWTKAFPKEKVKAAAETKAIGRKASLSKLLLNGELTLEVFPGLESGAIQLGVGRPEK
jgi:hypothetical protein